MRRRRGESRGARASHSAGRADVEIDVPDVIDLEWLRARGRQPNEPPMPDDATTATTAAASTVAKATLVKADETIVATLVSMGFSEVAPASGRAARRV